MQACCGANACAAGCDGGKATRPVVDCCKVVCKAVKAAAVVGTAALATTGVVKFVLDKPSRTYGSDTVAREYDAWADDGILEYYWGEHIHLGYYSPEEMKKGYKKKKLMQFYNCFIAERIGEVWREK